MAVTRTALQNDLHEWLNVAQFQDYCPNGLQIEGADLIRKVVTGVSISADLIDAAIAHGADTILCHHGFFWKNELAPIVGMKRHRIAKLLNNNINFFAYHLPLDAHPVVGNNAQLALQMGWQLDQMNRDWVCFGRPMVPIRLSELVRQLEVLTGRSCTYFATGDKLIERLAWCSGAAQSAMAQAIAAGVDVYITGEVSESNYYAARETSTAFVSAGHHATERLGIQALGHHIAKKYDVEVEFIDSANPV